MSVAPSRLTESGIRSAQLRLSAAYRFGRIYLRSSRTIQGRGIRIFNTTGMAIHMSTDIFFCVSVLSYVAQINYLRIVSCKS